MVGFEERVTLVEHLDELRRRIVIAVIALAVGVIVAAVCNNLVFAVLQHPIMILPGVPHQITTFSPAEPFMVSLKVWAYCGIVLASPIVIYEFWAFIGPAFSPVSRRTLVLVAATCAALFLFGVAFGYLIVLPKGLSWLLGFNGQYFNTQLRASEYFSFVAWFLVAFGAVFEMPVIIIAAVRMGIVETRFLRKHWRYAIVINAVIAMVATPSQDAFSFIAMFIPLEILYEASLVVAKVVEKRRAVEKAQAASDEQGSTTAPA
ncbi:MAG TPA: twin-arginine translocase subunit TatC [Thermoleophilia bacterium]|nr:twin-arginine translocase subunit TatC [Thermoleophilia bacterium]